MEFDSESLGYMDMSLNNLIMLKHFHDAGIDVSNFSDWIEDPSHYGSDIFIEGIQSLFGKDMTFFSGYEDVKEQPLLKYLEEEEQLDCMILINTEAVNAYYQDGNIYDFESDSHMISKYVSGVGLFLGYEYNNVELVVSCISFCKALEQFNFEDKDVAA